MVWQSYVVLLVYFVSAWFNYFCTSTAVEMTSTSLTAGPEPDCSAGVAGVHARDSTPELFTEALCAPARHKDLDVLATFQLLLIRETRQQFFCGRAEVDRQVLCLFQSKLKLEFS